ncbi:MAG TPA: 2-amino-4-hydroxy-6-hydroxymethyldihydropteridine diphosphokinase [Fibrobacteria bacterium]|nr:2-amino-4-hydroxy-6-hydroxymethyldihydropteridine diphosphokinase [Fibrobacteria bacterium]
MARPETVVLLALGSNLNDREGYIRQALEAIRSISASPVQKSKVYETAPVGPGPQGKYLNLVVRFSTRLEPRALLNFCLETETRLGRRSRGRWAAREIDLDILSYGREIIHEEGLAVPHPSILDRQFVLVPMTDLDPDFVLPGFKESVGRQLQRCIEVQGPQEVEEYRAMPASQASLPERIRYVAVEGVIGVGKSTLVKALCDRMGCMPLFEEFENNPFLSDFYKDKSRYAFQTQVFFFLSRYRQIQEIFHQQDLFRPQILSDYMFAKDKIFATLNLDENEVNLYYKFADILERNLIKPDYAIYLQADTRTLMHRIKLRDRPYERTMDEAYIEALNRAYNHFFHYYSGSPLLIINTNNIDFVRNPEDLNLLMDTIAKVPEGVTYFSPTSMGKK